MTTPKHNALHLMGKLAYEHCLKAYEMPPKDAQLYMFDAERLAKLVAVAVPKTSFAHWVDEVEASGEAEPTRDDNELAADFDHRLRDWNRKRAPHFAIPPSTDVATLQRELDLAYAGLERERGITKEQGERIKELAGALEPFTMFRLEDIAALGENERYTITMLGFHMQQAVAALSKVQHIAARGAEASE